jgi:lysozyme
VSQAPRHWAEHLRLSHHGAAFIALEEGVRTHPYPDSEGWATTFVGHLIQPMHKGVTAHDVQAWSCRTPREAIDYFRNHDVKAYEQAVRHALGRSMVTQAQYDMCVSLCFNIGTGGFASSSVARLIRQGHIRAAGNAFYAWSNPSVLRPRRGRESYRFSVGHW